MPANECSSAPFLCAGGQGAAGRACQVRRKSVCFRVFLSLTRFLSRSVCAVEKPAAEKGLFQRMFRRGTVKLGAPTAPNKTEEHANDDVGAVSAAAPVACQSTAHATLAQCVEAILATQQKREYAPPGSEALPLSQQSWRADLATIRTQQIATGHTDHSAALRDLLPQLERATQGVEQMIGKASLDVSQLDAAVNNRDSARQLALSCLEEWIESGKQVHALQARQEELLLRCEADQRADDADCSNVMELLNSVTALKEELMEEQRKTDAAVSALVAQLEVEIGRHNRWQQASEKLTRINRLLDMRQQLASVRKEKATQGSWVEESEAQETHLRGIMRLRDTAKECQEALSGMTRLLGRRQLQLEESCRFRDLLLSEGAAVPRDELDAAEQRVSEARTRFLDLKNSHAHLLEKAYRLGRSGFPEVWRSVAYHVRSGALLTLECFSNVRELRPPNILVGEKDGRSFVLKARKASHDSAALGRSFEKELYRLRHPLIMQVEATFLQGDTFYLVMPHYADGNLRDWLERHGGPTAVDRSTAKSMFRGLLQALTFLHSNGVVHGDVRLENIFIDHGKPVLAGFDAGEEGGGGSQFSLVASGAHMYAAPELFERGSRPTMASDMYAFGVCIFLVHFAADVYLAPQASHVYLPPDRDASLRSLLEMLLSRDPFARPSADECLANFWFRETVTERGDDAALTQLELFREMLRLTKNGIRGFPIRAKLAPDRIVQDGLALFASLENQARPLRVHFDGEKGSDAGGVTSSLYRRFFAEMLGNAAFFERRGAGTYLPVATAPVDAMRSFGIAVSRCLFDERVVDLPCASAMFKFLFNASCDFSDLESFDESQAQQLKGLLRCPGVDSFGLTFEFVDAGDQTAVTDTNKEQFVHQKIEFELITCRKQALVALRDGFWSLTALQKPLKLLGWRECVVLLSGSTFLSPAMVIGALNFDGFAEECQVPAFLSSVLEDMSVDMLRLFLFFVTEQPTIPFGGLRNPRSHPPVDKITVKPSRSPLDALPTSSVCFYCLHLPLYPTKEALREKLEKAVRESGCTLDLR